MCYSNYNKIFNTLTYLKKMQKGLVLKIFDNTLTKMVPQGLSWTVNGSVNGLRKTVSVITVTTMNVVENK